MADKTKSQITVGSLCWYRDQDGSAKKVQVVEVDRSIIPPKYWVVVDGRKRESEGIRLTLIQPPAQKQPPPQDQQQPPPQHQQPPPLPPAQSSPQQPPPGVGGQPPLPQMQPPPQMQQQQWQQLSQWQQAPQQQPQGGQYGSVLMQVGAHMGVGGSGMEQGQRQNGQLPMQAVGQQPQYQNGQQQQDPQFMGQPPLGAPAFAGGAGPHALGQPPTQGGPPGMPPWPPHGVQTPVSMQGMQAAGNPQPLQAGIMPQQNMHPGMQPQQFQVQAPAPGHMGVST
jgi:hypothetical protein